MYHKYNTVIWFPKSEHYSLIESPGNKRVFVGQCHRRPVYICFGTSLGQSQGVRWTVPDACRHCFLSSKNSAQRTGRLVGPFNVFRYDIHQANLGLSWGHPGTISGLLPANLGPVLVHVGLSDDPRWRFLVSEMARRRCKIPPSCLKRVPRGPQEDPKGQHVAAKRLRKAQDGRRVKMDPDEVQAPSDDGFGFNSGSILGSEISYCLVLFERFVRAVSVFFCC